MKKQAKYKGERWRKIAAAKRDGALNAAYTGAEA